MKKKTVIGIVAIVLPIVLCVLFIIMLLITEGVFDVYNCFQYNGWQTVTIENCGTLQIPSEWVYFEEDGFIYITDQYSEPIMIQTYSYAGNEENDLGNEESNKYFKSVVNLQTVSSAVYSNGAIHGKSLMIKDGEQSENYHINLVFDRRVMLIVWDETIDEGLVKKIAYSFSEFID